LQLVSASHAVAFIVVWVTKKEKEKKKKKDRPPCTIKSFHRPALVEHGQGGQMLVVRVSPLLGNPLNSTKPAACQRKENKQIISRKVYQKENSKSGALKRGRRPSFVTARRPTAVDVKVRVAGEGVEIFSIALLSFSILGKANWEEEEDRGRRSV
jgi:hypothetical protein